MCQWLWLEWIEGKCDQLPFIHSIHNHVWKSFSKLMFEKIDFEKSPKKQRVTILDILKSLKKASLGVKKCF